MFYHEIVFFCLFVCLFLRFFQEVLQRASHLTFYLRCTCTIWYYKWFLSFCLNLYLECRLCICLLRNSFHLGNPGTYPWRPIEELLIPLNVFWALMEMKQLFSYLGQWRCGNKMDVRIWRTSIVQASTCPFLFLKKFWETRTRLITTF